MQVSLSFFASRKPHGCKQGCKQHFYFHFHSPKAPPAEMHRPNKQPATWHLTATALGPCLAFDSSQPALSTSTSTSTALKPR